MEQKRNLERMGEHEMNEYVAVMFYFLSALSAGVLCGAFFAMIYLFLYKM